MKKSSKKCDICENDASSLCFDCIMYLCESCFKFIHDKKKNSNHKTEKIDYFIPIELKCHEHPKNIINLFCIDEKGNIILYNKIIYITLKYSRIMLSYLSL